MEKQTLKNVPGWTCEKLKERGQFIFGRDYVESCEPDPEKLDMARSEYADWLIDSDEAPSEVREIPSWTCQDLLADRQIEFCGPKAGQLTGEAALAQARQAVMEELMSQLNSEAGCPNLLWQEIVSSCEFAASDDSEAEEDLVPEDFIEDRIPASQHDAYEAGRGGESPENLAEYGLFLNTLLEGTQLLFQIRHPKNREETFKCSVSSVQGQSNSTFQSMEERFVIEVRAIEEDSWLESLFKKIGG